MCVCVGASSSSVSIKQEKSDKAEDAAAGQGVSVPDGVTASKDTLPGGKGFLNPSAGVTSAQKSTSSKRAKKPKMSSAGESADMNDL